MFRDKLFEKITMEPKRKKFGGKFNIKLWFIILYLPTNKNWFLVIFNKQTLIANNQGWALTS